MTLATMVLTGSLFITLPEGFENFFDACEHCYAGGQYHNQAFRYRLFVPRAMKPGDQYPLLVWLHGYSKAGLDNREQLGTVENILKDTDHLERYRFFVLAVQCPPGNPNWYTAQETEGRPGDMLTVLHEIMQKTMREQPIDSDRIYLAGVCSGGTSCWEMLMRYPDLFSAAAILASAHDDVARAKTLTHVPIWAFNNSGDSSVPLAKVRRMTEAINSVGGNAVVTVFQASGHDCWTETFELDVMDWMLAQRRGSWGWWGPQRYKPWRWWHILTVPIAFTAFVAVGVLSERRRRRRNRVQKVDPSTTNPSADALIRSHT